MGTISKQKETLHRCLDGKSFIILVAEIVQSSSEGRRGVVGRRGCSTGKSLLLNKLLGFEFLQNPRVGMGTSVPEQVLQRSLPRWERNWWWQPERRVLWDVLGR